MTDDYDAVYGDYFRLTLPNELNSAAAISPAWNGYIAAQVVLNTPMLFSSTPVSKYFILGASGTKNAVDKHHIFPKNYLTQIGYMTDRERNQIANFTYLDYVTNIDISDDRRKSTWNGIGTGWGKQNTAKPAKIMPSARL